MKISEEPGKGLKRFDISILEGTYRTVSRWVPEETDVEDAVQWAIENKHLIPCNGDLVVEIDEENCGFTEDD